MSINSVTISGNLTRDAELIATKSGLSMLSGSVAVNERVKDDAGQWTDKANFVDFVMFGERVEKIAGYMTKGVKVCLQGALSYSAWTDKKGNKRSKLSVIVREVEFFRPSKVVMDKPTAEQAARIKPEIRQAAQRARQKMEPLLYEDEEPTAQQPETARLQSLPSQTNYPNAHGNYDPYEMPF